MAFSLTLLALVAGWLEFTSQASAASNRSTYYTYDVMGRQLSARFDSAVGADGLTNTYDGFGDLTSSQISMGGFTKTLNSPASTYDAAGRRTQLVHPENTAAYTFTYAYDALGRLSGIYQGAGTSTPLETFGYGNNGLISSRSEAAASSVNYGYDNVGRLTSQSDAFVGGAGNVSRSLGFNPASQITTETRDNNSYAWSGAVAVTRPYSVNGLNQYKTAGTVSFGYDGNGNLTSDGTNTYVYDAGNRLVSAVSGTVTTTLTYDPLGRLFEVVKITSGVTNSDTRFVYDGDALIAEYDGSGNLTNRYVHGSNAAADEPLIWYSGADLSSSHWLHADHLGSIVAMTNNSGANSNINSYDEYGINGSSNYLGERFGYTGQAFIREVGLYYDKARMYSPTLGRFMQTDPIGYRDQINLYEYVGDDPVDKDDPTGEYDCPTQECKTIGDAIKEAKQEALQPELGSRLPSTLGREISRDLNNLGKMNDHNGITIQNGNLPKNTLGSTLGNSITLDFRQIQKAGGIYGYLVGAGVIVHEATHLADNRINGEITNNGQRFLRERHAFQNQSYIYYRIGIRPFGFGFPRWGEDRYSTDLNNAARADCEVSNSEHPLPEGCQ